ncbi:YigZ family protein [Halopenitus sp. POP-27]|uniref:IMPACT family protein n=1 Tax=Halopenitus sp. POP-27 TaxID=2994425 RepID=UPI0024689225|nr:YigZ family protein [Halopenitus sp. POP-27]
MTDPDPYLTVAERARAAFEVRGSEFIGHVGPASSVEGAETFVDAIRTEYDDATHNVPAYRVPATSPEERSSNGHGDDSVMIREYASDDGEPSGSAGKPALNVLQGRDLRNVVVVITRYYGGTNLGVGGLVRAYGRATKEAIEAAGIREEVPHRQLTVTTSYDDSGTVRGILESVGVDFEADYDVDVRFAVRVPVAAVAELEDRLRSATSGRVSIDE